MLIKHSLKQLKKQDEVLASPRLHVTINLRNFNHNENVTLPANVREMVK